MSAEQIPILLLMLAGLFFFVAGTAGLLRFPDTCSRLHALTKADNLGLGMICTALLLYQPSWLNAGKLLLIWVLMLFASATLSHLIARQIWHRDRK